jgi:hypothetical protein
MTIEAKSVPSAGKAVRPVYQDDVWGQGRGAICWKNGEGKEGGMSGTAIWDSHAY